MARVRSPALARSVPASTPTVAKHQYSVPRIAPYLVRLTSRRHTVSPRAERASESRCSTFCTTHDRVKITHAVITLAVSAKMLRPRSQPPPRMYPKTEFVPKIWSLNSTEKKTATTPTPTKRRKT